MTYFNKFILIIIIRDESRSRIIELNFKNSIRVQKESPKYTEYNYEVQTLEIVQT